jgi:exodeoxyribonuclease V alpha subunit
MLLRLSGSADEELEGLLRRLSAMTAAGNVCVSLHADPQSAEADGAALCERLLASGIAGTPGEFKPLILDAQGRLYLHRYWDYERRLATDLRTRAAAAVTDVDVGEIRPGLDRLFPATTDRWQKVAAAVAGLKRLCILSGGPGTGKTTTVVRVLALLAGLHRGTPLRMALAAPTGKAAARMQEAIRAARDALPIDAEMRSRIPDTATTLHRLLGGTPESAHFRHHRDNPLPVDVLVVDEASMVGVALMTRLVEALAPHARLLIVGDKDQLAAVEPGAVLGSLCAPANAYTPAFAASLASVTGQDVPIDAHANSPLRDVVVLLERSYRFGAQSGIARLAQAVRDGEADTATALLRSGGAADVEWRIGHPDAVALLDAIEAQIEDYARAVVHGDTEAVFAAFARFRVLAAHRHGPVGVQWLNAVIERALAARMRVRAARGWFAGRAVMVSRNHHALRLFNGDIGITLPADDDSGLRVVFRGEEGEMRKLAPSRLPQHEPAYALTVHKAQGSEFDEVLVLLPEADSPLLTRELLYTAITRARRRVQIRGSEAAIRTAIARQTTRTSGLHDACWGEISA